MRNRVEAASGPATPLGEGWVVALALRDPEVVARRLGEVGCSVVRTAGRLTLVQAAAELAPDGILLEVDERESDVVELVRTLSLVSAARVVVLVASTDPVLGTRLFEAGASDVVASDVALDELIARLRARLQEPHGPPRGERIPALVRGHGVEVDRGRRQVRREGGLVNLTPTEYEVIDALTARPGEVVPAASIAQTVWGDERPERIHAVRVYVGYLRRKLEQEPRRPRLLVSRWGQGYLLDATADEGETMGRTPAANGRRR